MSEVKSPHAGLTRRSFLKTTAVAAGATALAGGSALTALANEESTVKDEIFYGQCRGNCFGGCQLKMKVRDGKLVHTEQASFPVPEYNRLCSKGLGHPQRTYSTKRLQYPMRRVGERGAGEWERISWDDAINEITSKWKQYQKESGNNSILFNAGSSQSGKLVMGYTMLMNLMGATRIQFGYDAAATVICQKIVGRPKTLVGNTAISHKYAKTTLLIGTNIAVAQPNTFHFLLDAQENGGELIHIDPVYSLTSSRCDRYIPIRPCTDSALLLGMIHHVIEQGWVDEDYLCDATVAPYLVKESDGKYLRQSDLAATSEAGSEDSILVLDPETGRPVAAGSIKKPVLTGEFEIGGFKVKPAYQLLVENVKDWTLEKSAEICDIPADTIAEITEKFAKNTPSEIYMCYGLCQYNEGHRPYHAAFTLLALLGQFGKLGAGFGSLEAEITPFVFNPAMAVQNPNPGPTISAAILGDVMDNKRIGDMNIEPRSMFVYCHNPIANMADRLRAIETFGKFDLIVVADMLMTDTAKYADIILPVCGWHEQLDIIGGTAAPFVRLQEKAIDPLFESKNDYEIAQLLASGMGFGDRIPWAAEDFLKGFLSNQAAQKAGLSWERLLEEKSLYTGEFIHGENGVFPTPTGKMEIYLESFSHSPLLEGKSDGREFDIDFERLPNFKPPHEAWTESVGGYERNPLADKYPLIYTSIRNRFTTHSQHFEVDWFKEISPEPTIRMSPKDAQARGIKTGDIVRVFNDRGYVILKAEIHAGIRPGMVVYPKGWQDDQFIEGHVANLISSYTIPAVYNQYYFDVLCEVEKIEGR